MYNLVESLRWIALFIYPSMPSTAYGNLAPIGLG